MTRGLLFVVLAAAVASYSFWVYQRVELPVRGTRLLASVRAVTLVVILALLFDPRIPGTGSTAASTQWVLLDASLSMAAELDGSSPWREAQARAAELVDEGWGLVTFGDNTGALEELDYAPDQVRTSLAPTLERAAEAGVAAVRVLSDLRFEDGVAVRAALEALPLKVDFEAFGEGLVNAGISLLHVDAAARPEGVVTAIAEVHGTGVDSATLEVRADGEVVVSQLVDLPDPGLRRRIEIEIPVPGAAGRVRYSARVTTASDAFASDDEAIAYATVGHEEGALVLVSLRPDWEPRFLLSVLEDVTGLPGVGYLLVEPGRFVSIGPAVDRAGPVDSATVGRAVRDAALLVVHGIHGDVDAWSRRLLERTSSAILLAGDREGAGLAGVRTASPLTGEWYASGDIPPSPLVGELSGARLLGLPPLTDVLVPADGITVVSPLNLQLRGIGAPAAALHLDRNGGGRRALGLASGFWRWAMREGAGRDAYRRLWSGVAGWVLADDSMVPPEPRPAQWVFDRGDPVVWSLQGDSAGVRINVQRGDSVVADTLFRGGTSQSLGAMAPGLYSYRASSETGEVLAVGRFDVAATSSEMIPTPTLPEPISAGVATFAEERGGRPLRTSPWPYLLLIMLLCGEWVARRRTGLR
jgi:hypothetical protein